MMTINPGSLPLLLMNSLCLFLRPNQLLMGWISPPLRDISLWLNLLYQFSSVFFWLLFSAGCKYGIKYLILKNTCPQPSTHLDILHFSNHCPSNKILFVIYLHAQRQKWYFYSASIPLLEIIRINNPFADWLGISDLVPAMQVSAKMMQFIQSMAMSIMSHPFLFINECVDNLYVCGQYL